MENSFKQKKRSVLNKKDKSSKGDWDKKIQKLCDRINKFDNYLTTSSCSGRIMVVYDKEKKDPGIIYWVSHDKVKLKNFLKIIPQEKQDFKFKQEPPILHISCMNMDAAKKLLKKVQSAGWKRSGIISVGKTVIIEVIGTEKIELPLIRKGKLLVDDKFLEIVLKKSNENLEKSWEKIEKLRESL